jgi:3-hydroxyisobutyrate dehydrogenase-like beta-hydroxyacid dehydrogenase
MHTYGVNRRIAGHEPGEEKMKERIGFIGVGLMGNPLARNLISAGYSVIAHDIDPEKVEAIVNAGGKRVASPADMPFEVDVIILSLVSAEAVNDVIRNSLRLFETRREGLVVLDASTIDSQASVELASELRANGIEMLDSTVSGSPAMCAARENIFMVGGRKEVFQRCEPIFAAMSKEYVYVGENGKAIETKLVVNLVLSMHYMALAEGLTLARKAGLDEGQTLDVLMKSAAYSKAMDMKGERMVKRQFLPAIGKQDLYMKDMQLILALGARLNCPLPLISLNAQAVASELSKGRAEWDNSSIISFYSELANV